MKKVRFLFAAIEKLYWVIFGILILAAFILIAILTWIGVEGSVSEFIQMIMTSEEVAKYLGPDGGIGAWTLFIFAFLTSALSIFITAIVFRNLKKFIDLRSSGKSLLQQKNLLSKVPRLIVILYALSFISIFFISSKTNNLEEAKFANEHPYLDNVLSLFDFQLGSPLGLIIAFLIYLYCKNLDENQILVEEANRLRQEAELVI